MLLSTHQLSTSPRHNAAVQKAVIIGVMPSIPFLIQSDLHVYDFFLINPPRYTKSFFQDQSAFPRARNIVVWWRLGHWGTQQLSLIHMSQKETQTIPSQLHWLALSPSFFHFTVKDTTIFQIQSIFTYSDIFIQSDPHPWSLSLNF